MEWNEERIATLEKLWREGLSASQVARQLGGVSRSAVIGKVHRLGISGRETPQRPRPLGARVPSAPKMRIALTAANTSIRPAQSMPPRRPAPICFVGGPTATLVTLEAHSCRWPYGDPGDDGFGFCGRERGDGAYCEGHVAISRRGGAGKPVAFRAREMSRDDQDSSVQYLRVANG